MSASNASKYERWLNQASEADGTHNLRHLPSPYRTIFLKPDSGSGKNGGPDPGPRGGSGRVGLGLGLEARPGTSLVQTVPYGPKGLGTGQVAQMNTVPTGKKTVKLCTTSILPFGFSGDAMCTQITGKLAFAGWKTFSDRGNQGPYEAKNADKTLREEEHRIHQTPGS
ncbi:hypothetical protein B0H11DRAFT_2191922 [Mycena galericulata]|nr:hypothetical protein B0H11DRAFT_2191922 [Mycena galericulata]